MPPALTLPAAKLATRFMGRPIFRQQRSAPICAAPSPRHASHGYFTALLGFQAQQVTRWVSRQSNARSLRMTKLAAAQLAIYLLLGRALLSRHAGPAARKAPAARRPLRRHDAKVDGGDDTSLKCSPRASLLTQHGLIDTPF